MAMLDVFDGSAFTMASLTEAINKMPFPPMRLGSMGIFADRPIRTTVAHVEERQGILHLLNTAGRGSMKEAYSRPQRVVTNFNVPHTPLFAEILADDIQNIRAFGSETELEAIAAVVNDTLAEMQASHAVTQEFQRVKATEGVILDGDGATVIYDLFTQFGMQDQANDRTDITFTFATDDLEIKCNEVHRAMADSLGATPYTGIVGIAGNDFFDSFSTNDKVRLAFDRPDQGAFLRRNKLGPDWANTANGFIFNDILFLNYRGQVGDVKYVADDTCNFIAMGVPGLFIEILAPADFMETVNTRGQRYYAKQHRLPFDKGIELHTQTNSLAICTRPKSLIKGTAA